MLDTRELQTLFLLIYKNRHLIFAVASKNTPMLEMYDSLDNDDLFRGQPDYAFREERNAILGSEVIQCFKHLERNNNDWFREILRNYRFRNLNGWPILTTVVCFSSAPWLTELMGNILHQSRIPWLSV